MAEDDHHAAENEIDQEDIRNLHIDGNLNQFQAFVREIQFERFVFLF